MKNEVLDGIMGLCVADALGVPVEFNSREKLKANSVTDMRAYGTHNQPSGTWSDDTSIVYHDGQYVDDNRSVATHEEPLTLLLQYADSWSGFVLEK